ncbi:MAG: cation transporter [Clostridiales bacterium]
MINSSFYKEKFILQLSMAASVVFTVIEVVMAIFTNSQAVLMDAIIDSIELIMIIFSLRLLPLLYKPTNEKRPYGYNQAESLVVLIKSFMMLAVTAGLIINNVQMLLEGGNHIAYGLVAGFEIFAAVVGIIIILIMEKSNKHLNSPLVDAEITVWKIDIIASCGLGIAFLVPVVIKTPFTAAIAPYLDQTVAIILSLILVQQPIRYIITTFRDMFLFAPEAETMDRIKELAEPILVFHEVDTTCYDVIRTGRKLWVSIYFEPKSETLSVLRISRIQKEIDDALTKEFDDLYLELLPDIY